MFDYQIVLDVVDNVTGKLNAINKRLEKLAITGLAVGVGIAKGMKDAINAFSEYEQAFKNVRKAFNGTAKDFDMMDARFRKFKGASYESLAGIATEVSKAGITNVDQLMDITETFAKVGQAFDMNAQESAFGILKFIDKLGFTDKAAEGVKLLADAMSNLENSIAGVKVDGMMNFIQKSSGIIGSVSNSKWSLDQQMQGSAAVAAYMSKMTATPERAAEVFRMIMSETNKGGKLSQFKSLIEKSSNLGEGTLAVLEALKGKGDAWIRKTLGKDIFNAYTEVFGSSGSSDLFKQVLDQSRLSAGAMSKEWEIYLGTFQAQADYASKRVKNAFAKIGKPLANMITKSLDSGALKGIFNTLDTFTYNVSLGLDAGDFSALKNQFEQFFNNLKQGNVDWITMAIVIGSVIGALSLLGAGLAVVSFAFVTLVGVVSSLLNPFVLLGVVIALLYFNWDTLVVAIQNFFGVSSTTATVLLVIASTLAVVTLAVWAFNGALLANPITWIMIAVMALIAGLAYLAYIFRDEIVGAANTAWEALKALGGWLASGLMGIVDGITSKFAGLVNVIQNVVSMASNAWNTVKGWVSDSTTATANINSNINGQSGRVDVNVKADSGSHVTQTKSTGSVNLRNKTNY